MEKEKIREIVSQEIKHTRFRKSHPSRMMDLEESLVESLHQALSMSDECMASSRLRTQSIDIRN